jgi:hypothetical protein
MATEIRFGIIGLGLMGREFASAAARWIHLTNLDVRPVIVAACDSNAKAFDWFKASVPTLGFVTTDYHELSARKISTDIERYGIQAGRCAGVAANRSWLPERLPDNYGQYIRVRVHGLYPPDVGGIL